MSKTNIVVIGTSTFDTFLKGFKHEVIVSNVFTNNKALAIAYGSKEKVEILEYHIGGGAMNISFALANFGLNTSVITRRGSDYAGDFVFKKLKEKKNILTGLIQKDKEEETASSCILITGNGENSVLSHKGCNKNLVVDGKVLNKLKAKILINSTMSGNPDNFKVVFEYKQKHPETLLISNPGFIDFTLLKKNIDWLKNYDVFILNQEEASYLSDLDFKKEKEIFAWLYEHVQGICIMTRGADGLMFTDGKDIYSAKISTNLVVIDSTGAGDAFVAGFVLGYCKDKNLEYGIRFGLANSTQVIEKIGANTGCLKPEDLKLERWKNKFEVIGINKIS